MGDKNKNILGRFPDVIDNRYPPADPPTPTTTKSTNFKFNPTNEGNIRVCSYDSSSNNSGCNGNESGNLDDETESESDAEEEDEEEEDYKDKDKYEVTAEFASFMNLFKQSLHFDKCLANSKDIKKTIYLDLTKESNSTIGLAQYRIGVHNLTNNKEEKGMKYLKLAENSLGPSGEPASIVRILKVLLYADNPDMYHELIELSNLKNFKIELSQIKCEKQSILEAEKKKFADKKKKNEYSFVYWLAGEVAFYVYDAYKEKKEDSQEIYYYLKFAALDCKNPKAEMRLEQIKAFKKNKIQQETCSPSSEFNHISFGATIEEAPEDFVISLDKNECSSHQPGTNVQIEDIMILSDCSL